MNIKKKIKKNYIKIGIKIKIINKNFYIKKFK